MLTDKSFLTEWAEAKSILCSLNRRQASPRSQRYCEILSLKTLLMAGAPLSCQFIWPRPFTRHLIISVCAQRDTSILQTTPGGLSAWRRVFDEGTNAASYRNRRSTLEAWFCSTGIHGSCVFLTPGGGEGGGFPLHITPMEYSLVVVLSVRFWC